MGFNLIFKKWKHWLNNGSILKFFKKQNHFFLHFTTNLILPLCFNICNTIRIFEIKSLITPIWIKFY